jgi:hypothetical protein
MSTELCMYEASTSTPVNTNPDSLDGQRDARLQPRLNIVLDVAVRVMRHRPNWDIKTAPPVLRLRLCEYEPRHTLR